MMNAGNRKPLLPLLILAIILCGAMALGSTFASGVLRNENNATGIEKEIANGQYVLEYDVDILCSDGNSLLTSKPFENTIWCPGYTEVVSGTIVNNEMFPIECTLNLLVSENQFAPVMEYASLNPSTTVLTQHSNWDSFRGASSNKNTLQEGSYPLFTRVLVLPDNPVKYAFAIHMDTNASNHNQGKSMKLDFEFVVEANYKHGADPKTTTAQ